MKLEKKKELASRALLVGKNRIAFNINRLGEIKEAITKQDIKDLVADGAIIIKEIKGRRTIVKSTGRRRAGSIKKKIKPGKRAYIIRTRRMRSFLAQLRRKEKLSREAYLTLRKEIRASIFRDLSHLKERIKELGQ
jgi:large subunit ribosomal protein L19e